MARGVRDVARLSILALMAGRANEDLSHPIDSVYYVKRHCCWNSFVVKDLK